MFQENLSFFRFFLISFMDTTVQRKYDKNSLSTLSKQAAQVMLLHQLCKGREQRSVGSLVIEQLRLRDPLPLLTLQWLHHPGFTATRDLCRDKDCDVMLLDGRHDVVVGGDDLGRGRVKDQTGLFKRLA